MYWFLIASCSLGAAQQSIKLSIDYVKERKQFGHRLADFQVSSWFLNTIKNKEQANLGTIYKHDKM